MSARRDGRGRGVRWGQNFLVDRGVAESIVEWARIDGRDVLEIGPGRGILTDLLAARASSLVALEIDPKLSNSLERRFAGRPDVRVLRGDALAFEPECLPAIPVHVVANLPYESGTAIVERLLSFPGVFTDMTVMLQREVCERILAGPGGKGYGLLALNVALLADVVAGRDVPASCFRPAPRVRSRVVRIRPLRAPRHDVGDPALFRELTGVAFRGRRKMLRNTLVPWIEARLEPGAGERLLRAAGIEPAARPERVALAEFAALSAAVRAEIDC